MKACSTCYRIFPSEAAFCPMDGAALVPYEHVPPQPGTGDPVVGSIVATRYEIRRVVADGGMGRVYEARDIVADRRVAVKFLRSEVARDPVAVERFRREFEISKQLAHPHVVDVLDFQELGEQQFVLIMEFLDGEELRHVLDRERCISPARWIRILSQVTLALTSAHTAQVVHRDLKPDNIFLCSSPTGDWVKLLDFGSVRLNKDRERSKLTNIGTTIGSPYYMSPEQAQGVEHLDHRADVFALGAISYECLTGTLPFTGSNGPAILLSILTKNPPPLSTYQGPFRFSTNLDDVIDDALAKKPDMRTSSVAAFTDALGQALGLKGDHTLWAQTSIAELHKQIEQARIHTQNAMPIVEADPFAKKASQMPMQQASKSAAQALDQAFETAALSELEPAGVPKRSYTLVVVLAIALLVIVMAIVFVWLKPF